MVCSTDKSNLVSVVILNKETMSKMCMWCPEGVFSSFFFFFASLAKKKKTTQNYPELYNETPSFLVMANL